MRFYVGAGHWPARGRGTPQGGFSRPSSDSPLAPPLQDSRASSKFWVGESLGAPAVDDSGKKVTLIRLAYARHLPPWRGKARAADSRPYGFTKAYLNPWRAGEDTRPYGVFSTGNVCSVNSGAVVEPHQRKFMQTQGPVARREFRPATQILRAGNIAKPNKYASPVMGVLGGGRHGGGRLCRTADCARLLAVFW